MSTSKSYSEQIRGAAILTTSYVASTILGKNTPQSTCLGYNQLVLYVTYDPGSSDSIQIKIEFGDTETGTFYQQIGTAYSSGTTTSVVNEYSFADTGAKTTFRIAIPIADRFIKVSAKCTGTATSSSCTIDATLTNVG